MASEEAYCQAENRRHADLRASRLTAEEATQLCCLLSDLLKIKRPRLVFKALEEAGSYNPHTNTMKFDPETLSKLVVVHEMAHAVEGKLPGPHHGARHRLLVDAIAALARVVS